MFKQTWWWLAGGAVLVSFLTLLTGAGGGYVVAQLVALLGFAAFCALAPRLPFVFALMVIATLAKNFAISQVVKILLWQRADLGLQAPVETAWIVAAGTWACVVAAGLYAIAKPRQGATTLLSRDVPRPALLMAAWTFAIAGIAAKEVFYAAPASSVVFTYVGDLAYAGAAAFAYDLWRRTDGKRLLDWRVVAVSCAMLLIALQSGSKFNILAPFVFVAALHAAFKVRPRPALIIASAALFFSLASVIYPIVNYARAAGGPYQQSVPAVLETIIQDPSRFAAIQGASDAIESRWNTRLYYGRPVGILGRFTPNQIGDLASVAPYTDLAIGPYLLDSARGLLPQTFGYQRQANLGQAELESAFQRQHTMGFNNSNYGLMGDLYLHGGLGIVFLGMAAFCGLILALYTLAFGGQRNDIWALPFGLGGMFWMADMGLSGNLIATVHGALIEWGAVAGVLILASILARGGAGAPAQAFDKRRAMAR